MKALVSMDSHTVPLTGSNLVEAAADAAEERHHLWESMLAQWGRGGAAVCFQPGPPVSLSFIWRRHILFKPFGKS